MPQAPTIVQLECPICTRSVYVPDDSDGELVTCDHCQTPLITDNDDKRNVTLYVAPEQIRITGKDADRFAAALENPREPNDFLKALFKP